MQLHEIVTRLIQDTQGSLWPTFAPELVLTCTILAMLIIRILPGGKRVPGFLMALIGTSVALYYAAPWLYLSADGGVQRRELFTGMLVYDGFTVYVRAFLLLFAALFAVFTRLTGNPDENDSVEFYCLTLGATIGMCLMSAANHLMMVFMSVEMASVPSYALAGQLKAKRKSSEAALKYSIYGAGAAGIMLYGISLLAGVLNSAHLPTMAVQLSSLLPHLAPDQQMVLILGGLMLMVGLAFKLSAVPFHFWCPDVFEGASAEVNAFLSIASKAGALALLVRVAIGFGMVPEAYRNTTAVAQVATAESGAAAETSHTNARYATALTSEAAEDASAEPLSADAQRAAVYGGDALAPSRQFIAVMIGVIAMVTCTFGNLAAYGQTNIKRLMAYSTIAHAGYMMMAVPAAVAMVGSHPQIARNAVAALALYVAVYLLMNLAAFALIAFFRNSLGSEEISAYSGLVRRAPLAVICFALTLFSLVGLPPLAGFLGKFAIFAALAEGWQATGSQLLMALLIVGGLNTAISLFYYLRVVKVMTIDPELDHNATVSSVVPFLSGAFLALLVVPIVTMLLYTNTINEWTLAATRHLF